MTNKWELPSYEPDLSMGRFEIDFIWEGVRGREVIGFADVQDIVCSDADLIYYVFMRRALALGGVQLLLVHGAFPWVPTGGINFYFYPIAPLKLLTIEYQFKPEVRFITIE